MATSDAIAALSGYFDGTVREASYDTAAYLMTVDPDGWPHAAMVSVGELRVDPAGAVRVTLWEGSATTANLCRSGAASLAVAFPGRAIRARLALFRAGTVDGGEAGRLVLFQGSVTRVTVDDARYAEVIAGVRFALRDPEPTLARWRRTQRLIAEFPDRAG